MAQVKLTIIDGRKFKFPDGTGERMMYTAFNDKEKGITFSSENYSHRIHKGEIGFDPEKCESIDLQVKIWDGKAKYSEIVPTIEDEEFSEDE